MNLVTGQVCPVRPATNKFAGGLLCDEPGLGKTVTCLALILKTMDASDQKKSQEDYEMDTVYNLRSPSLRRRRIERSELIRTKATLIIAPDHLIDHWNQQVL